jgi:cyclohexanone monooxygenase
MATDVTSEIHPSDPALDVEAIIIGSGFAGIRMLYELRLSGVSARVLEAGTDVGGTWYWNRYPGARTDTEAWAYCFRFDQEMLDEWEFPERFPTQPQVHKYLTAVVDRLDMRKDIQFSARVEGAKWDEGAGQWLVQIAGGDTLRCRWLISGTGLLSDPLPMPFPGADSFRGETYSSNRWPERDPDFKGKRVGIVGTGASAVQIIPEVAQEAGHLTVFQRTPNYVMPGRNYPISERQRQWIRDNHESLWDLCDQQVFGFPWTTLGRMFADVEPAEYDQVFEAGWEAGGFQFAFRTFDDILVNQDCNDLASEFVRNKIRAIVDDPGTAETLCPTDHPVFGKRPPLGHFYYEAFNRPNVSLVSVKDNPIVEIVPEGLKTQDGTVHEVDMIIFALGFDAVTGAITQIDLEGRGGLKITDRWQDGAQALLGISVDGFPNFFSIIGPQSAFTNIPPTIEKQAAFIGAAIRTARDAGSEVVEADPSAVHEWAEHCQTLLDATILQNGEAGSWFLGTNVPGKPRTVLFYFGGAGAYFGELAERAASGFPGFVMEPAGAPA